LAPRKKKLTTLKKRVLEERLRIWKERNGEESVDPVAGGGGGGEADANTSGSHQKQDKDGSEKSTTLLVDNFVNPEEDDLTDDDEHDELVTNLINLAGRVGRVVSVYIPRPSSDNNDEEMGGGESALDESNHVGLSFVRLATYQDAHAARDILDGMVVGGQKLCTKILFSMALEVCDCEFVNKSPAASPSQENEQQWRRALFKAVIANQTSSSLQEKTSLHKGGDGNSSLQPSSESTIVFHNILSSDDYEDEDALEESIEDIKSIAGQYGHVANARGDDAGNVYVTYDTRDIASFAAQKLDGMLLGGVSIAVSVESSMSTNRTQQAGSSTVVLDNVLSEDDFEDEDCLNESIEDIRSLAEKYGVVGSLNVDTSNEEEKGKIHVEYTGGIAVAGEAAKQLNGMMFGGRLVSATLLSSDTEDTTIMDNNRAAKPVKDHTNIEQEPPQPMFSGDKVIPERFAQCKRVPKVANSGTPRAYASKIADPGTIPLLTEMLGELMRLQQRSKDQKNARSRRRLVMGLREVARGIRAHKVKMVVMANNLDEYGAIDSKLQEILDLAHAEDVPVIFELNKRKLGKAVGKSIKVSVVGVQNVMGAEQQFKQLKKMAGIS
jgi:selenocysteine insertion sequence-binding protein 2